MNLYWLILVIWSLYATSLTADSFDLTATLEKNTSTANQGEYQHHLDRRIPWNPDDLGSDNMWNLAVTNGYRLICQMRRTDKDAGKVFHDTRTPRSAESLYAHVWPEKWPEKLSEWGWWEHPPSPNALKFREYYGWGSALAGLRVRAAAAFHKAYRIEHWNPRSADPKGTQHYERQGRIYWATGAKAHFAFNRRDGIIYVQGFTSLKHAFHQVMGHPANDDDLPAIRNFSDIVWGYYVKNRNDIPDLAKRLKYFGLMRINQPAALQMIARALQHRGVREPQLWPGDTFEIGTEEGTALVGTLGASIAYLLMTHKDQLGLKHVSRVTIFRSDHINNDVYDDFYPQVIFHLEDVPPMLLIPQEADNWQPGLANDPVSASSGSFNTSTHKRDVEGHHIRIHTIRV